MPHVPQVEDGQVVGMGGVPSVVNAALAKYFPAEEGIIVIAEPGRCAPQVDCPA